MTRRSRLSLLAAAMTALGLAGCKESQYPVQLKSFSSAIGTAATSVGAIYSSINDDEQTLYMQQLLVDPNRRVGTRDFCVATNRTTGAQTIESGATPLGAPRFPPKEIALRTGLLQLLQKYADALSALASNSAPADVKSSLSDLGASYAKVAPLVAGSQRWTTMSGPLSAIFGDAANIYLQRRRTTELNAIVIRGQPVIDGVVDGLIGDVRQAKDIELYDLAAEASGWQLMYERWRHATLSGSAPYTYRSVLPDCANMSGGPVVVPPPVSMSAPHASVVVKLDAQRDASMFTRRQLALQNAAAAKKAYTALNDSDVVGALASLKKAYDKLADFARTPDDQATITNLQSAVSTFGTQVQDIYTNLQTLRNPPKKGS